jgi:hypothetical protein
VQAVLHASGISLAHVGTVPLLQGGVAVPTRIDWLQHTTGATQQLSQVQILVELDHVMEQVRSSRQDLEGGIHDVELVEGALPACLRQQRSRCHRT